MAKEAKKLAKAFAAAYLNMVQKRIKKEDFAHVLAKDERPDVINDILKEASKVNREKWLRKKYLDPDSTIMRFIYVSALNGDKITHLKIAHAKEKFVDALKASGMSYCIMRPNGFFSDMAEMFHMAQKGRIYLFGKGDLKSNPIHGADLAEACVDAIESTALEIEIGGPETLTQNEIAHIAFEAAGRKTKITYIPDWFRRAVLRLGNLFMSDQKFGPIEFFMTVLAMEMVAPEYGRHTLGAFFEGLKRQQET